MRFLTRWLLLSLTVFALPYLLPGIHVSTFTAAIIAAAVIGIINACLKPILLVLTLPVRILTLGIFTLILNAALLYLVPVFVSGFSITSFWSAFLASIILSIVGTWINGATKRSH